MYVVDITKNYCKCMMVHLLMSEMTRTLKGTMRVVSD